MRDKTAQLAIAIIATAVASALIDTAIGYVGSGGWRGVVHQVAVLACGGIIMRHSR